MTDVCEELRPDYSKDFWQVAEAYTRHILQQTGSLALLGNTRTNMGDYVPSWVSDFRPYYLTTSLDAGKSCRQTNLQFQNGLKELVVDGLKIRRIIGHTPCVPPNSWMPERETTRRNAAIASFTFAWTALIPHIANAMERTIQGMWEESMNTLPAVIGLRIPFDDYTQVLEALANDEHEHHKTAEGLLVLYKTYGFAMLQDGSLLFSWPSSCSFGEVEHFAVYLPGALSFSILEELPDGKHRWVAQGQYSKDLALHPSPYFVEDASALANFGLGGLQRFVLV